jgi:hypothetical protein
MFNNLYELASHYFFHTKSIHNIMNYYLLNIGISEYKDNSHYESLTNAREDAELFKHLLEERYNVELIEELYDASATKENILSALQKCIETVNDNEEDNLIIFFSGHGIKLPNNNLGYIVPSNGNNVLNLISHNHIKSECLPFIEAKHILIIYDCCYSGTFLEKTRGINVGATTSYDKRQNIDSRYLLASGGDEKVSDGNTGKSQSPFMDHLYDYLQSNTKSKVAITELGSHIKQNVGDSNRQQPVCEPISELFQHKTGGEFIFELQERYVKYNPSTADDKRIHTFPNMMPSYEEYLNEPGANFLHQRVDTILLEDIFVEPNVRCIDKLQEGEEIAKSKKLWEVAKIEDDSKDNLKIILLGEETSCKTAIAKRAFLRFYNLGYLPVILDGSKDFSSIQKNKIEDKVKNKFREQYESYFEFSDYEDKLIIIVDDFHKLGTGKNNREYKDIFMQNLDSLHDKIILLGNKTLSLELSDAKSNPNNTLSKFITYEILSFGVILRKELVEKWTSLGNDIVFDDQNDLLRQYDEMERQINSFIGSGRDNYMPPYPFYILSVIQTIESKVSKPTSSLHGFYYEQLINNQLISAVEKDEISMYGNLLPSLMHYMFSKNKRELSIDKFKEFYAEYEQMYPVDSYKKVLMVLEKARLLNIENNKVSAKYKYIYFFYVAKYLSNNIEEQKTKEVVTKMCKRLHREEYSSILIFLTHLSKSPFLIEEILNNAKKIFTEYEVVRLDKDTESIDNLLEDLPKQVISNVKAKEVRETKLIELERQEIEEEYEEMFENHEPYTIDDKVDNLDFISEMTIAIKSVDLLGQLVKKYWGSLNYAQSKEIIENAYHLSLRTLRKYFNYLEQESETIAEMVRGMLLEVESNNSFTTNKVTASSDTITEATNKLIFKLCFMSVYSLTRRVSSSTGHKIMIEKGMFDKIASENDYNSVLLFDIAIDLEYQKKLPFGKIKKLKKEFLGNKLATLTLRTLVIDRLNYFDEDYEDMQRISDLLGIPMSAQRRISNTSSEKK